MRELATVQDELSPEWGPNFAGMIRDIVERKHTRVDSPSPQYLPQTKILLCPNDSVNNRPQTDSPPLWPTASIDRFSELPRTIVEEAMLGKSFISYFYVALWRTDDRSDFILMADQSNDDDTTVQSFTRLTTEDNHGVRGMNILLIDSHVEWTPTRSGSFEDMQHVAQRYWGPIVATRVRYGGTTGENRSVEVQTIE